MDEWLICSVVALYTDDCNVVRREAGLSESFKVMVGLYQGSVLSSWLFDVDLYVVSSETRSGLPSELQYADDLILMTKQWSSLLDVRLNGEQAFLTTD